MKKLLLKALNDSGATDYLTKPFLYSRTIGKN